MKGTLLASPLLLATFIISSCASPRAAVPYANATHDIEGLLLSRVDKGIFDYSKTSTPGQTTFRFIEGDKWDKLDHATPLRVEIAVRPLDQGADSRVEIKAMEDKVVIRYPDREAEMRWDKEIHEMTHHRSP
jgi:hypothetical protein